MKKYTIVVHSLDCGTDSFGDYPTIKDAIKAAKWYKKEYDSVFIYDYIKRAVRHAFSGFPDGIFAKDVDMSKITYHW